MNDCVTFPYFMEIVIDSFWKIKQGQVEDQQIIYFSIS